MCTITRGPKVKCVFLETEFIGRTVSDVWNSVTNNGIWESYVPFFVPNVSEAL
jgi:hypothetical protein